MTHDFLLKAKSNPDLQDFCEYLIKPLQILEELEYRYKNLPLDVKVKHINMALHLKVEKIMIGAYTIKDNKENIILDKNKLKSVCNLKSTQNASLIFTSS